MISKTIGFFGVHNIFRQTQMAIFEEHGIMILWTMRLCRHIFRLIGIRSVQDRKGSRELRMAAGALLQAPWWKGYQRCKRLGSSGTNSPVTHIAVGWWVATPIDKGLSESRNWESLPSDQCNGMTLVPFFVFVFLLRIFPMRMCFLQIQAFLSGKLASGSWSPSCFSKILAGSWIVNHIELHS